MGSAKPSTHSTMSPTHSFPTTNRQMLLSDSRDKDDRRSIPSATYPVGPSHSSGINRNRRIKIAPSAHITQEISWKRPPRAFDPR